MKICFGIKKALLITLILLLGVSAFYGLKKGIQPGQPLNDSGVILITDAVADQIKNTGSKYVRINFRIPSMYGSDTSAWYAQYDTIVNRLRARGLTIIGCVCNEFKAGSQTDWQQNAHELGGTDGGNSYLSDFGNRFARVAAHYNNLVTFWEIWNEPNCYTSSYGQGGSFIYPSNFAWLLSYCYKQVKYYNHYNVRIISGGLFGHNMYGNSEDAAGGVYLKNTYIQGTSYGDWNWCKSTLGTYPLDDIGQHIYIDNGPGEASESTISQYLDWIRNDYVAYEGTGTMKQTFITEFGWRTASVTEGVQANNVFHAYRMFKNRNYVESYIWFYLQDNGDPNLSYGLLRSDGSQKPAYGNFVYCKQSVSVSFLSKANNQYVCADNGGQNPLIANRTAVGQWETYELFPDADAGGLCWILSRANNRFVTADSSGNYSLIANRTAVGPWEEYYLNNGYQSGTMAIKANSNQKFSCADLSRMNPPQLINNRTAVGQWESYVCVTNADYVQ